MKYADNTQGVVVSSYDPNGNATQVQFRKDVGTPASAVIWNQTFDVFNRMTHREVAFNAVEGDPTFFGTTWQDFTFDDASRLVVSLDRSPAAFGADQDIWVESQFDTAGRRFQERQRMPINGGAYKDRVVASSFGVDGFRTGLTYPTSYSGGTALAPYALTMQPDALGRLSTITGPLDSLEPPVGQGSRATETLATYTWVGSSVWDRLSGNGLDQQSFDLTGTSLYDGLGRIRGVRSVDAQNPGFVVTDFRYGYDRAGNRTYEQRRHEALDSSGSTFRTRTYKTDLMGRLAGWKEKGLAADSPSTPIVPVDDADPTDGLPAASDGEDWSLDLLGNWTSQTIGVTAPVTKSFTPNSFNQYASVDPDGSGGPQPPVTLDYDWLGQLWKDRDADRTYQWDAFGRMTQAYQGVTNPALIATYRYDAMNRRVEKSVSQNYATGDLVTRFIYDGWRAIEERGIIETSQGQDEAVRARYGFGVGLDELIWMDRDLSASGPVPNGDIESRFYVSQDALGSVTAATRDRQGTGTLQVAEHYTYSAYGQVKVWTGAWLWQSGTYGGGYQNESTIGLPYLYTGQRQDYETRLYYSKNRYFDPTRGAFLRRDPLGLSGGPNLYAYCESGPQQRTDPLGLKWLQIAELLRFRIGETFKRERAQETWGRIQEGKENPFAPGAIPPWLVVADSATTDGSAGGTDVDGSDISMTFNFSTRAVDRLQDAYQRLDDAYHWYLSPEADTPLPDNTPRILQEQLVPAGAAPPISCDGCALEEVAAGRSLGPIIKVPHSEDFALKTIGVFAGASALGGAIGAAGIAANAAAEGAEALGLGGPATIEEAADFLEGYAQEGASGGLALLARFLSDAEIELVLRGGPLAGAVLGKAVHLYTAFHAELVLPGRFIVTPRFSPSCS